MRQHLQLLLFGLALVAVSAAIADTTASAERQDRPHQLDTLVVTATRAEQHAQQVPSRVTVITADDLARIGATSVVEALKKIGGLHFRSLTGQEAHAQVSMRGFGENSHLRTLVLLNGHKLNRPDMGGIDWLQVPVGNVERIEIVHGPQSAMHGNAAVGGVINIITKKPDPEQKKLSADLSGTWGSHGLDNQRLSTHGTLGALGYALALERYVNEGYRERSAYEANSGALNLSYDLTPEIKLRSGVSRVDSRYQFPGQLSARQVAVNPRQANDPDHDGESRTTTIDGGIDIDWSEHGRLILDGQYRERDQQSYLGLQQYTENTLGSWSLTPRYVWEGPIGPVDQKLTLGVDFLRDDLDLERFQDRARSATLAQANLYQQAYGAYIGSETGFGKQFVLSTAVRAERADIASDYHDFRFARRSYSASKPFDGQAYSLGLTYAPWAACRFYTRFDRLYRYPAIDEIADYQGAYMGDLFNQQLDAETGRNYELGVSLEFFEGWSLNSSLYQLDMRNEIAWDAVARVNSNLDDTRRRGTECELRAELTDSLRCTVTYHYVHPKLADGPMKGRDIPLVPRQRLRVALEADLPAGFSIRLDMSHTGSVYQGSGPAAYTLPHLPEYTLWDLVLRYDPPRFSQRLSMFVGIDNLGGKEYISSGYSGGLYPAPGRTIKGGVTLSY